MGTDGADDWYDVSNVDGFNLPMTIKPTTDDDSCKDCSCVPSVLLLLGQRLTRGFAQVRERPQP